MKGLKIYLITAGVLLTLYIVAEFNRPKIVDWTETLNAQQKTPFGAYILFNQATDIFKGSVVMGYHRPVYNVIVDDSIANSSYVIIAPVLEFSKLDYETLIDYIKKGNDVFIAAENFGKAIEKKLHLETTTDFRLDNLTNPVNFSSPSLRRKEDYSMDKGIGTSYFLNFDTAKTVVLGENKDHKANFIKYTIGKGTLFLMANPKFFGNYSMLQPQGLQYAGTALSFVKNTDKVIWDEYYTQGDDEVDSPMRLFLSNGALQWAYYLALFTLSAFVLYEIKRRQRVIPLVDPLNNSTLEFVNVVGQVYYEKRNNADIAHKKIQYLFTNLRDAYQLKDAKPDEELAAKLVAKLGIDETFANKLADFITQINSGVHVNDRDLIKLNTLIEKLYTQIA